MFGQFFIFLKTKVVLPVITGVIALFGITAPPPVAYVPERFPEAPRVATSTPLPLPSKGSASTTPKKPPAKQTRAATSTPPQQEAISAAKQRVLAKIAAGDFLPTEAVNASTRPALMNILCTSRAGGSPVSGTGIIVSETGLVLTNAHVAQYLLLKDYGSPGNLTCVGRTGSPAVPAYTLELAYLPQGWLEENARKIREESPLGTGERDFAFLAVTGTISGAALPPLPHVALEAEDVLVIGTPVFLAAYPAGFLGGITLEKDLWMTSSASDVSTLYYFNDPGKIDVFAVKGSIISQKGASGGAAVSLVSGNLLGMITTATDAETTGGRELMALSFPYIRAEFEKGAGKNFEGFLASPPSALVQAFNESSRSLLRDMLVRALEQR